MTATPPGRRFEVEQYQPTQVRWVDGDNPESLVLGDGSILLKVMRFGLTANNITYTLYGTSFGYWRFFEASAGYGIIPVWGYADVVRSNCSQIEVGERVFGFLPMASHLVMRPAKIKATSFYDSATHRADLPPTYNEYVRAGSDPAHAPIYQDRQILLKPLLTLAWLVADMLEEADFFGARQVVITAASSRTALGLAKALHDGRQVKAIGVTSGANRAFVEALNIYAQVATYDSIDVVPIEPTCIVDIAGNHATLHALHAQLSGLLERSFRVGDTGQAGSAAADLDDPQPALFFAPDQIRKRRVEWGSEEYARRYDAALACLGDWISGWLTIEEASGPTAIEHAYHEVRSGRVGPARAHILCP